jgi:hypothetical protein
MDPALVQTLLMDKQTTEHRSKGKHSEASIHCFRRGSLKERRKGENDGRRAIYKIGLFSGTTEIKRWIREIDTSGKVRSRFHCSHTLNSQQ